MRSLMRLLQFPESLAQSARSGTRLLGSLDNNFLKRQPDLLSKYDERDPAENRARVAPRRRRDLTSEPWLEEQNLQRERNGALHECMQ